MIESDIIISLFKTGIAILFLTIITLKDNSSRKVPAYYFLIFGIIGIVMFVLIPTQLEPFNITLLIISAIIILVMIFTTSIGIADLLAMVILFFTAPQVTLHSISDQISIVTPFTVMINALFLSILIIPANLIENYIKSRKHNIFNEFKETKFNKLKAMMIGSYNTMYGRGFPFEKIVRSSDSGIVYKRFDFSRRNANKTEFTTQIYTWIIRTPPFLFLMLGGYILQITYGDILYNVFLKGLNIGI